MKILVPNSSIFFTHKKKSAPSFPLSIAYVVVLYALQADSVELPKLPSLAKIVVLVQQQEIYQYDSHPLQHRQVVATTNCINQCSYVNQALTTCADDACFCPAVTVGASTCSECYATVNVTAASIWSSVIGICSSEFPAGITTTTSSATPVTATATPSFPAACTSQCALISQALVACADDVCFCPTATVAGAVCSQCLATVNITRAGEIGSAMSICSSEFGTTSAGDGTLTFGSPTTSFNEFTEYNTPTPTTSNNALLGASTNSFTSPTASSSSSSSGGLSKGAIGGIVGAVVALLVIGMIILFLCIRRPKRHDLGYATDQDQPDPVAASKDYRPPNYPPPPTKGEASIESNSTVEVNNVPSGRLRYPEADEGLRVPEPEGPAGARLSSG